MSALPPAELAQAIARGRAAWPDIDVPDDELARFLAQRAGAPHAADLYLACACARGDAAAVRAFEAHVLTEVEPAVRRLAPDADFATEVKQRVRAQLLVGDAPGIRDYQGRGPLVSWVRIVASRVALMMLRADKGAERRADALAEQPAPPGFDAELELIRARHREPFRKAFAEALLELSAHERNLLQLHIVDGVSLSQIGALHRVNKSTVSRWIAAASAKLEAGLRERLQTAHDLDDRDLDSLVGLLRSRIDLSVERLLGGGDPPDSD